MMDWAPVHTENASEQVLHHNRTLILVHTVHTGATSETEQKPIRYSVNIPLFFFKFRSRHSTSKLLRGLWIKTEGRKV